MQAYCRLLFVGKFEFVISCVYRSTGPVTDWLGSAAAQ